ncbi:hypothetical protein [Chiayiivirga flava]|uniref:Alpha/beta hydrolase n=1 Tax=Chiayiivirga flava TaxID=659595 RepID=A0A7W8D6E0_9GAMM|nr:hypothetical protein [Chiayiivirga flava]MBB5208377.1 hypothetical protein [Chiayiivirga flava]
MKYLILFSLVLLCACSINHGAYRSSGCADGACPATADLPALCSSGRSLSWEPTGCVSEPDAGVPYAIATVEIDDFGDLWDQGQLQRASDALTRLKDKQVLFLVFIHGWKHSGHPDDGNFRSFRKIVMSLRGGAVCDALQGKQAGQASDGCAIFGLYLSWRGNSLGDGPVSNLSFWDRKAAAIRSSDIPASNVLASLIGQVAQQDRDRLGFLKGETSLNEIFLNASRIALIGHSFGARFLEGAMGQVLVGRKELATRMNVTQRVRSIDGVLESRASMIDAIERLITQVRAEQANVARQIIELELQLAQLGGADNAGKSDAELDSLVAAAYNADALREVSNALERQWRKTRMALDDVADVLEANDPSGRRADVIASMRDTDASYRRSQALLAEARAVEKPSLDQIRSGCTVEGAGMAFLPSLDGAQLGTLREHTRKLQIAVAQLSEDVDPFERTRLRGLLPDRSLARDRNALAVNFDDLAATVQQLTDDGNDALDAVCGVSNARERLLTRMQALAQQRQTLAAQTQRIGEFAFESMENFRKQSEDSETYVRELLLDTVELMRPPADVALMVNPATEGIRAEQMIQSMARWNTSAEKLVGGHYEPSPMMIQVASTGDFATARLFSMAGQIGDALRLRARPGNDHDPSRPMDLGPQADLVRRPAPQIASALSHRACVNDALGEASNEGTAPLFAASFLRALEGTHSAGTGASFSYLADTEHDGTKAVWIVPATTVDAPLGNCDAPRIETAQSSSSLWVISGGDKFMPGHNDVFGGAIGGLLGSLLRKSTTFTYSCPQQSAHTEPETVCGAYQRVQLQKAELRRLQQTLEKELASDAVGLPDTPLAARSQNLHR